MIDRGNYHVDGSFSKDVVVVERGRNREHDFDSESLINALRSTSHGREIIVITSIRKLALEHFGWQSINISILTVARFFTPK